MTRLRRGLRLMIVQHGGRRTRTVELPRWTLVLWPVALAPLIVVCGLAGFHLQGQLGVRGPAVQWEPSTLQEHWLRFQRAGPTVRLLTYAQLRRRAALARALRLSLGSRAVAGTLLSGKVKPAWQRAAGDPDPDHGTLRWPVPTGWFVRGYGSGEAGYHQAVDIMGSRGSDVVAAAPGIVGYAGNAVRGYGNLVLIIHPGGFVTGYAHNQRNRVVTGQRVTRGERIAALGSTGISRGPHVHFEVMRDGRSCDPLPMFRPGVRHRAGHIGQVAVARWMAGENRPKAVACGPRRRHPRSRWVAK